MSIYTCNAWLVCCNRSVDSVEWIIYAGIVINLNSLDWFDKFAGNVSYRFSVIKTQSWNNICYANIYDI